MRSALLTLALSFALGCGHGAGDVQFTVRDPSGKILRAPANTARFDAARQELAQLVGHGVSVQIDAGLLPNDLAGFSEHYARMVETVVASLRALQRNDADAFERVGKHLDSVDIRYDATLDQAEGTLDGSALRVRSPAGLHGADVGAAIGDALSSSYQADDGAKLFAMSPVQVPPARRLAYVDVVTHYSTYDKQKTKAPSWDPKGDVVGSDARGRSLQKLLALYPHLDSSTLRDDVGRHLVEEGEYYVLGMHGERTRAASLQAPSDAVVRQTRDAYVAFLQHELTRLPDALQTRAARQLFPQDDESARAAFAGFDRMGWALSLAQTAFGTQQPMRADGVVDEVVCPYHEDEHGALDRNRSCNAGFYRAALADESARKRLAGFLTKADRRATQTAFANLRWASDPGVFDLFHDVEANAATRTAAGKVLGDVFGREGEWREQVRKEGYALYGRRSDARGLAVYMILATDPHRGLEAVSAGVSPALGADEIRALLAVGPRAVDFVASGWSALTFPKASLLAPYLRAGTKTDTLLTLARAACAEGKPGELQSLRTSMENAARASQTERSRYDGALELIRRDACPPAR